jgi:diguanylate cyclase (GGDEF)-like protein
MLELATRKDEVTATQPVGDHAGEPAFRLLVVEDSPHYAALVGEMLADSWRGALEVEYAGSVEEASEALVARGAECVLLDMLLPDARGPEGAAAISEVAPDVPIIVLSGMEDEDVAVDAVQQGADDYMLKSYADGNLLSRAIRYAVERRRSQAELARQALHDSLTGLPNRTLFSDRLDRALARSERSGSAVGVLFFDIDRFKPINDSLGHEAGDQVLVEIAKRVIAMLRPSDTVARFGGDEFMMVCEDLRSEHDAAAIAQRLLEAVSRPITVGTRQLSVTTSVGIALGRGPESGADVIRDADVAMYRAKKTGAGFALFDKRMQERALNKLDMEEELRLAIEGQEFRLLYQPLVRLDTGELFAVEALLRWEHPVRGLLPPAEFLEIAEESELIVPIGEWVLREACRQLRAWREESPNAQGLRVQVNVSARQLAASGLVELVREVMSDASLRHGDLVLEITETAAVANVDAAAATMMQLKQAGASISMDDFGTGYSSLSLLSRFPVDGLKIDREFVSGVTADPRCRSMVAAMVGLGDDMHLDVVAEGVEDERQPSQLRALGCESAQGRLFDGPEPAAAISELIAEGAVVDSSRRSQPSTAASVGVPS